MVGMNDIVGKRIFVILKTGRRYSGMVDSIEDKIIAITDKFNEPVMFSISEISSMEVENKDG